MAVELRVPEVGESITEVEIGDWLKGEGEKVSREEPVVMIETDKVTVELPAPVAGIISKIVVPKGKQAKVGDVIRFTESLNLLECFVPEKNTCPIVRACEMRSVLYQARAAFFAVPFFAAVFFAGFCFARGESPRSSRLLSTRSVLNAGCRSRPCPPMPW